MISDEMKQGEKACPSVSVIIPVHNGEKTLERCLHSVLSQSFPNLEVIAVDDASTDKSLQILKSYEESSNDVLKVVPLEHNSKQLIALKEGVKRSSGKYIVFLDADDELLPGSLQRIYDALESEGVDILHFPLDVVAPEGVDAGKVVEYCAPLPQRISDSESILKTCLEERKFSWSIVNKAYNGEMCRSAFGDTRDIMAQRANDYYIFTHIAARASSYLGLSGPFCYVYHYGEGQDGDKQISLSELESFCESAQYALAILEEIDSGILPAYLKEGALQTANRLVDNCVSKMLNFVEADKQPEAMRILVSVWGYKDIALSLLRNGLKNKQDEVARLFSATEIVEGKTETDPKHVAAYYRSCEGGGVESVLRALSEVWHTSGKAVTWFLEEEPQGRVPDYVDVVILADATESDASSMERRFDTLSKEVQGRKIEAVVYHHWLKDMLIWDLIAAKSSGSCSFTIHCHGNFANQMRFGVYYFSRMPDVYALADAVVVVNPVDRIFWSQFNARTFLTNNPIPDYLLGASKSSGENKTVLWLGRISPEKCPEKAVKIFRRIRDLVPEARFVLAGSATSASYENKIRDLILSNKLEDAVDMPGWCDEEKKLELFRSASVFLMTSEREGYPVTLIEAKAAGLPVVMFDLPYLSVLQNPKGIETVAQDDYLGAATKAAELLENEAIWGQMASESAESFSTLMEYSQEGFWRNVWMAAGDKTPGNVALDNLDFVLWDTLFESYTEALNVWNRKYRAECDKEKKLKKEIDKLHSSRSWKIGRAVTAVPRRLKQIVRRWK